jgi:hypothetical protein
MIRGNFISLSILVVHGWKMLPIGVHYQISLDLALITLTFIIHLGDIMDKKVTLELIGLDGNAFSILGAFKTAARKQGWTDAEISVVRSKAMEGDYNHLLRTISSHCTK